MNKPKPKPQKRVVAQQTPGERVLNKAEAHPVDTFFGEIFGRPNAENLDALTPETAPDLDALTPKNEDLDAQTRQRPGKWTKYDARRRTARLALRPDESILKEIKKFAVDAGMDLTAVTELAWRQLLDAQKDEKAANLGVLTPLNNKQLIMYRTQPHIINLYLRYAPRKKWRAHDDKAACKFNEADPRVVELGILQTLGNAPKAKINSFAYFVPEIETWLETALSDEALDNVLEVLRSRRNKLSNI